MKLTKQLFWLMAVTAMTLTLSSCSKESPVMETIPATVTYVAKIDGNKLLDALEIKNEGGKITLPAYFGVPNNDTDSETAGRLLASIDAANIYVAVDGNPAAAASGLKSGFAAWATAEVKDADAFAEAMTKISNTEPKSEGNYRVWEGVVLAPNQAWAILQNGNEPVKALEEILKRAADSSIADLSGVAGELNTGDLAAFASRSFIPGEKDRTAWGVAHINIKGNAIEGTGKSIWDNGSAAEMPGMTAISQDALRYVGANPLIVSAAGISDKMPWGDIIGAVAKQAGLGAAETAQIGMVLPYLQAIDGTVLFAATPAGGLTPQEAVKSLFAEQWNAVNFLLMAHYKRDNAMQLINLGRTMLPQTGVNIVTDGDNGFHVAIPGTPLTVYASYTDGYLCLSTGAAAAVTDGGSSLSAKFNGKQAAMDMQIPDLSFIDPAFNYGISAVSETAGANGKMKIQLTGTEAPFLPTVIKSIMALK